MKRASSSNHLDVECIEALGEALSSWGGKDGSVVVVSHDRAFAQQIGFTHVGTVKDGGLVIEERGLNDKDWERYDIASTSGDGSSDTDASSAVEDKAEQEKKRKLAFNAPKRIKKIEDMIEQSELKIAEYDEKMMDIGNDLEKLMEMTELKTKEEENVASLMEEWEMLESVIDEVSNI